MKEADSGTGAGESGAIGETYAVAPGDRTAAEQHIDRAISEYPPTQAKRSA